MHGSGLDGETIEVLERVLGEHGVSFAMVFGSGARGTMDEESDLDVAIEFDTVRPTDDGYSERYLRLQTALEATLSIPVDVVDVHAMEPRFASVAFDEGRLIRGTESRKAELAECYAGEAPSVTNARERVRAAVERLQDGTVG
ncbi:type VII toxin-antitoxin system MntA family adenylyltransferase antitoxin [Halovivax limisalsi]|uniref:type VII toxin-antitoxin system MntA family adenylyltransferase antitoxin n=1 Tax=Halovivax limisalsi TaxID=1453760 RepID=UPI001FFD37E9|nr:nucleotidyltransferase domain-containing protein [Halovivax limisalsi]